MTESSKIELLADSSQIVKATKNLDSLVNAGGKTESTAGRIQRKFTDLNRATKEASASAKVFSETLSSVGSDFSQARGNLEQFISDQIKLGNKIDENGQVINSQGQIVKNATQFFKDLKSEYIDTANSADRLSSEIEKVNQATDRNQAAALEAKLSQAQMADAIGASNKESNRQKVELGEVNRLLEQQAAAAAKASESLRSIATSFQSAEVKLKEFIADQIKLGNTITDNGTVLDRNGDAVKDLTAEYKLLQGAFVDSINDVDKLTAAMNQASLATDKNQAAALEAKLKQYELDAAAEQARKTVEAQKKTFNEAGKAYKNINNSADLAAKRTAEFSRKGAQASIQIEQLISTIAAGANPTQAFAFQAADLGIVLGAPLIGSAVAITAAIAGFVSAADQAEEKADEFKESLRELGEQYVLTANQQRALNVLDEEESQSRKDRIKEIKQEISEQSKIYQAAEQELVQGRKLSALRKGVSRTEDLEKYRKESKEASDQIAILSAELEKLQQDAGELNKELSTNEAAESLKAQILELEAGAQAAEIYRATQAATTDELKAQLPETIALINKKYELKAADEAATQAARDQIQAVKEEEQAYDAFLKKLEQAEAAEVRAAEAKRSRLEATASGTSGLTQLQVLEQQFEQEQELLLRANEAGIESKISYEERITELQRQYAEQRKQILDSEAGAQMSYLSETESEVVGAVGQALGSMAQVAAQGGKDAFERYKALASAQALIAGFLAANKALAEGGPIAGPILATAIGITTAANVAAIQSQEYQARALGGQVNRNQPYLVGERGPELFTPNSSGNGRITPFNQLVNSQGGNGETVNKTANITFALPEGNADFRQRVSQNRDLFYNIVQQAMNDRGMRMGGRR